MLLHLEVHYVLLSEGCKLHYPTNTADAILALC